MVAMDYKDWHGNIVVGIFIVHNWESIKENKEYSFFGTSLNKPHISEYCTAYVWTWTVRSIVSASGGCVIMRV